MLTFKLDEDFLALGSSSILTEGVVTFGPGALAGRSVLLERADTRFCSSGSSSEGGGVAVSVRPFSLISSVVAEPELRAVGAAFSLLSVL